MGHPRALVHENVSSKLHISADEVNCLGVFLLSQWDNPIHKVRLVSRGINYFSSGTPESRGRGEILWGSWKNMTFWHTLAPSLSRFRICQASFLFMPAQLTTAFADAVTKATELENIQRLSWWTLNSVQLDPVWFSFKSKKLNIFQFGHLENTIDTMK